MKYSLFIELDLSKMENGSTTTPPIFSCGMELAGAVVASDVLTQSLETIAGINGSSTGCLRINISNKPYCNVIAFEAPQIENLEGAEDLVSSEDLDKLKFPFIDLLCYKTIHSFSIHRMAADAFGSAFDELDALYTQCVGGSKPLIITGHSLGGSVASLFTLWLLGRINPATTKLPLCVTYGAPLIGDDRLSKAISQRSIWDSCFLHVVGELDPIPKFLASISSSMYKPFGTYLLTSQSGCACSNDPESVTLLLKATYLTGVGIQFSSLVHYGEVVGNLRRNIVVNGEVQGNDEWITRSQYAGIATQLEAIGISSSQQWHQNTDMGHLCTTLGQHEQRARFNAEIRSAMDPSRKLNDMKINMANLEWYKKKTQDEETGYYDSFKNPWTRREYEVQKYKKLLTKYWNDVVAQAEQKPQAEGRVLRTRYIGSGTNYRRMVEPLDIAEHYKENNSDYTANRPECYARLEEWLDMERVVDERNAPRTAAPNLTEDSCFWAQVEQATVWCKSLANGGPEQEIFRHKLGQFENYVWSLLKEKTVSCDIFLRRSSFMQWWRYYSAFLQPSDYSEFIWYMRNGQYVNYK